jgi:hypothetical protein
VPPDESLGNVVIVVVANNVEIAWQARAIVGSPAWLATPWSLSRSSRRAETGGWAEAIVSSNDCWRLNAATPIPDCGLVNHA